MALTGALLTYLQGKFVDRVYFRQIRFRMYRAVVAGYSAFMYGERGFVHDGVDIVDTDDFTDIESLTRLTHVNRLFSAWLRASDANGPTTPFVEFTDDDGRQRNRNWGQLVEDLYSLVQREGYSTDLVATMDGLVLCVFCLAHYGDDDTFFTQQDVLGGPMIRHIARMFLLSLGNPPQNL